MKIIPLFSMRFALIIPLAATLFSGCSGVKTYPNTLTKNIKVRTSTSSGSIFSSVGAAVDIYSVDSKCKTTYEGTVQLDKSSVDIGITVGKTSYLGFIFATSTFLAGSSSTITQGTLLTPMAGYKYDVTATYQDSIYNVEIREKRPKRSKKRNIALKELDSCESK